MTRLDDKFLVDLTPCANAMDPTEEAVAYLAGPMRGYSLNNFQAFFAEAIRLRRHGWIIHNPAEYDMGAGVDPSKPESEWPITVREMLRTDFQLILDLCNAIIMLPGWDDSVGAKMELAIAYHTGLRMFEVVGNELRELHIAEAPQVTFTMASALEAGL